MLVIVRENVIQHSNDWTRIVFKKRNEILLTQFRFDEKGVSKKHVREV